MSTLSTIACSLEQNDPTLELELTRTHPTSLRTSTTVFQAENLDVSNSSSTSGISMGVSCSSASGHNSSSIMNGSTVLSNGFALDPNDRHIMTSDADALPFRKRSVSCSVVYSGPSDRQYNCETIMEE